MDFNAKDFDDLDIDRIVKYMVRGCLYSGKTLTDVGKLQEIIEGNDGSFVLLSCALILSQFCQKTNVDMDLIVRILKRVHSKNTEGEELLC